jgi:hypothetical protein
MPMTTPEDLLESVGQRYAKIFKYSKREKTTNEEIDKF